MVAFPKIAGLVYRKSNWFNEKVTSFCNIEMIAYERAIDATEDDDDDDDDDEDDEGVAVTVGGIVDTNVTGMLECS